jgi:hypothetical protein
MKTKPPAVQPPLTPESFSPHRCKWIAGHDYVARMRAGLDPYCGAPVKPGSSWCADHHALVYHPAQLRALTR